MNWNEKRVLITGGAGFIGSNLSNLLAFKGAKITVFDKDPENNRNLKDINSNIKIVMGDISSEGDFYKINENFDYIFHLAAVANPRTCEKKPEMAFQSNVIGTFNVLNFALSKKVKKVVFPSSAQLYGEYPDYLPTNEECKIKPYESIYNITKKMGEDLCTFFSKKYELNTIIFRLFNVYGPRQSMEYLLPTVIQQGLISNKVEIWSSSPTRDFIYVDDILQALLIGAEKETVRGPINLGTGLETQIGTIIDKIANILNVEVFDLKKEVSGAKKMRCDGSLAGDILNWYPKTSLSEGLDKTIKWYKKEKDSNP